MAHRAAAALEQAALDRKARIVEIEQRAELSDLIGIQKLGVGAGQHHGVAASGESIALRVAVEEIEDAALRDHGVVIEVLLQTLPELQGQFVERFIALEEVVGADDRGVAPDIS